MACACCQILLFDTKRSQKHLYAKIPQFSVYKMVEKDIVGFSDDERQIPELLLAFLLIFFFFFAFSSRWAKK